jgi:diguanylate cyclase (GGDEF)-like protein/PAS domain S-box-containing protein
MFKQTKIRTLIAAAILLLQTLLIIVGASGAYGIYAGTYAHRHTYDNIAQLLAIERQKSALSQARARLDLVVSGVEAGNQDAAGRDTAVLEATRLVASSDQQWQSYRNSWMDARERLLARAADRARVRLETKDIFPLMALLHIGDLDDARLLLKSGLAPDYRAYSDSVASLEDYQISESAQLFASSVGIEQRALWLVVIIVLAGFITTLWVAFIFRRTIASPLKYALSQLEHIESGNLTDDVVIERKDEIGVLLDGLKRMKNALSASMNELRSNERRYRLLYETTPAMLQSTDSDGLLVHVSDKWLSTLGYTREEVIRRPWTEFLEKESRERVDETGWGSDEAVEYQMCRKDGSVIDISAGSIVDRDGDEGRLLYLTVLDDITERKRARIELANQVEKLRITLHSIGDGVITTDANGRVEYLNPVAENLTGWTCATAAGQPSSTVFHIVNETTRSRAESPIDVCLQEDRIVGLANHTILIGRDGREYHIEDSAAPIKDAAGQTFGVVLVFHDVSEQHRLSCEMTYRATHDMLTGLLNRDEFERRLKAVLDSTKPDRLSHALMYIDLDQFKLVNEAAGHAAGDRLLKQVVDVIHKLTQPVDTFARLGGDEFGLIVERYSLQTARELAARICETIGTFRFHHGDQRFHTGASIGLVPLDERWPTTASVLQAADSACYAAKESGRNRVQIYVESDHAIESRRQGMRWIRRIEDALDTERFVLHWQHITPLSAAVEGVHGEILLRLVGDDGKLILPGAFLPSAERFHMVSRIDRWVIRKVFGWMAEYREELSNVSTVAINLSGLSIGDRGFQQYTVDLLARTEFDHRKLCFEITETTAIANMADASNFFDVMQQHGIRFALDDFGSGMSSFGYLKNLPVEYLKIDGQFIRDLEHDMVGQATVRCICDIAKITGKKTIAEFVETESVETLLREIGIDYTQGFLRHRPAALEHVFPACPASRVNDHSR